MKNLELEDLTVQEMTNIVGGTWIGKFFLKLGNIFTAIGEIIEKIF